MNSDFVGKFRLIIENFWLEPNFATALIFFANYIKNQKLKWFKSYDTNAKKPLKHQKCKKCKGTLHKCSAPRNDRLTFFERYSFSWQKMARNGRKMAIYQSQFWASGSIWKSDGIFEGILVRIIWKFPIRIIGIWDLWQCNHYDQRKGEASHSLL